MLTKKWSEHVAVLLLRRISLGCLAPTFLLIALLLVLVLGCLVSLLRLGLLFRFLLSLLFFIVLAIDLSGWFLVNRNSRSFFFLLLSRLFLLFFVLTSFLIVVGVLFLVILLLRLLFIASSFPVTRFIVIRLITPCIRIYSYY